MTANPFRYQAEHIHGAVPDVLHWRSSRTSHRWPQTTLKNSCWIASYVWRFFSNLFSSALCSKSLSASKNSTVPGCTTSGARWFGWFGSHTSWVVQSSGLFWPKASKYHRPAALNQSSFSFLGQGIGCEQGQQSKGRPVTFFLVRSSQMISKMDDLLQNKGFPHSIKWSGSKIIKRPKLPINWFRCPKKGTCHWVWPYFPDSAPKHMAVGQTHWILYFWGRLALKTLSRVQGFHIFQSVVLHQKTIAPTIATWRWQRSVQKMVKKVAMLTRHQAFDMLSSHGLHRHVLFWGELLLGCFKGPSLKRRYSSLGCVLSLMLRAQTYLRPLTFALRFSARWDISAQIIRAVWFLRANI